MTYMRPLKLRAGAAVVRLVGWKMRSTDNTVEYDPARQRNTMFSILFCMYRITKHVAVLALTWVI